MFTLFMPIKKQRLFCDLENKKIKSDNENTIWFFKSSKKKTNAPKNKSVGIKI